jgi:hypothetical protein
MPVQAPESRSEDLGFEVRGLSIGPLNQLLEAADRRPQRGRYMKAHGFSRGSKATNKPSPSGAIQISHLHTQSARAGSKRFTRQPPNPGAHHKRDPTNRSTEETERRM